MCTYIAPVALPEKWLSFVTYARVDTRARTEKHKTGSYDRFSIQRGKIPLTSSPAQASEREAKVPVVLIHSMWREAVPLKHWRMQIDASIILKCISSNSVEYARMY